MLGKLLKHEFRATGRVMLPVLGVLVVLTLLFNLSVRLIDTTNSTLLNVLFGLIIFAFVAGIIAAEIIALVMINRFYKNLLGEEGYLMHTLPVTVHELVWSKIIVSFVWFLALNLLIALLLGCSALLLSGSDLSAMFHDFPAWSEIWEELRQVGLYPRHFVLLGLEYLLLLIIGGVAACLHFYAAMAIGHSAANHKGLFSVLAFIGISMLFNILSGMFGATGFDTVERVFVNADTAAATIRGLQSVLGAVVGWELAQTALLYAATALGLKRWLNLA